MAGKLEVFNAYELPIRKENEMSIISNAIQDSKNREIFLKKVMYSDFRLPEFQTIAWAIKKAHEKGLTIDNQAILLESVAAPIKQLIPAQLLNDLLINFKTVSSSDFEIYVNELKIDSIKSKIIDASFGSLYNICITPGADLGEVEKRIDYMKTIIKTGYSSSILEFKSMEEIMKEYNESLGKQTNFRSTGFRQLDAEMNEGFKEGAITLIAAPPSCGKSSFTLSMMKNLANKRIHTAQFALEMNSMSLTTKLLAFNTNIPITLLTKDFEKLIDNQKAIYEYEKTRLANNPFLWLNDKPSQSLNQIRQQTMMLQDHLQKEYIVIPIDLFGKIRDFAGSDNFARDYENKLNEVQVMVRELNVHYILVAQINREVTKGKLKRPKMSNLKNAGALEEVADNIFAIHRPYYDSEKALKEEIKRKGLYQEEEESQEDPNAEFERNLAEVIILKQRMGSNNRIVNFFMDPQTTKFQPWDTLDQDTLNKAKYLELSKSDEDY